MSLVTRMFHSGWKQKHLTMLTYILNQQYKIIESVNPISHILDVFLGGIKVNP